jgi:signal transduction histidine kinase
MRDRRLFAIAIVAALAMFVPGVLIGARWWNSWFTVVGGVLMLLLAFLVGARVDGPAAVVALVALAFGSSNGDLSDSVVSMWVFTVPAWVVGRVMRSRSALSAQLSERADQLEREREEFARESVRYERARIARDLHDVVAHNLSMIVIQAAAAGRALPANPEIAAASLEHIAAGAGQAELEIDQLVSLLADDATKATTSGLRRLDELIRFASASGLSVTYTCSGSHDGLPHALDEVAYRVVQEGITNALKHASGAPIKVAVDASATRLAVTVENGPPAGTSNRLTGAGGGYGLAGLRDRVAAGGGSLEAGPTTADGWLLAAQLPRGGVASPS